MGFKVQDRGKQDGNSLVGSTRGRVLCRLNPQRNKYRLRFNGVLSSFGVMEPLGFRHIGARQFSA